MGGTCSKAPSVHTSSSAKPQLPEDSHTHDANVNGYAKGATSTSSSSGGFKASHNGQDGEIDQSCGSVSTPNEHSKNMGWSPSSRSPSSQRSSLVRGTAQQQSTPEVPEIGSVRNLFSQGTADSEFTYRGGLKGLKLKPEQQAKQRQQQDRASGTEEGGANEQRNQLSPLDNPSSSRSDSEESEKSQLVCLDWLESDSVGDDGNEGAEQFSGDFDENFEHKSGKHSHSMTNDEGFKPRVQSGSESDADEEDVADFLNDEGDDNEFDDSSENEEPEGSTGKNPNSQSSNSDQIYQHQFKEFEKEWQSLETLNLVLERAQIPKQQQENFLNALQREEFKPGAYIVREGEMGDKFYVITEGEVVVTKNTPQERKRRKSLVERISSTLRRKTEVPEKIITRLYQGHFFGETSLAKEEPRNANVKVPQDGEKVVCMSMTKDVFKPFLEQEANFRKMIGELMMKKEEVRSRRQSVSMSKLRDMAKKQTQLTENDAKILRLLRRVRTNDGKVVINNYLLSKLLGKGSYGSVWLGRHLGSGQQCAVKVVSRAMLRKKQLNKRSNAQVLREFAVMKKLSHPNLVKLYEVIDDPEGDLFYMVQEYSELGPVMTEQEYNQPLDISVARKYFRDILQALQYLHYQGVAHRDIKPSNVLVSTNGTCKVADFGASVITKDGMAELNDVKGTPAFQPPEVFTTDTGGRYDAIAVDMWAAGATLHCMVVGIPPYMANNELELVEKLKNEPFRLAANIQMDPHLKNLLLRLLTKDPKQRATLADVVEHDWVTEEGSMPLVMPSYKYLDLANNLETIEKDIEKKHKHHARKAARNSIYKSADSPKIAERHHSFGSSNSSNGDSFYSTEGKSKGHEFDSPPRGRLRSESVESEPSPEPRRNYFDNAMGSSIAPAADDDRNDLTDVCGTVSSSLPPQSPYGTGQALARIRSVDDNGYNAAGISPTVHGGRGSPRHAEVCAPRFRRSGSSDASLKNNTSPFGIRMNATNKSLRTTTSAYHMMRASSRLLKDRSPERSGLDRKTNDALAARAHLQKLRTREQWLHDKQSDNKGTDILQEQTRFTSYPVETESIIEEILFDSSGSVIDPLETPHSKSGSTGANGLSASHSNLRSSGENDQSEHKRCNSDILLKHFTDEHEAASGLTSPGGFDLTNGDATSEEAHQVNVSVTGSPTTSKPLSPVLETPASSGGTSDKGYPGFNSSDEEERKSNIQLNTSLSDSDTKSSGGQSSLTRSDEFMMLPKASHSGGSAKVVYRVEGGIMRAHAMNDEHQKKQSADNSSSQHSMKAPLFSSRENTIEETDDQYHIVSDDQGSDSSDLSGAEEVETVDDMVGDRINKNLEHVLDGLGRVTDQQLSGLTEKESQKWKSCRKDLHLHAPRQNEHIQCLMDEDIPQEKLTNSSVSLSRRDGGKDTSGATSYNTSGANHDTSNGNMKAGSNIRKDVQGRNETLGAVYSLAAKQGNLSVMEDRAVIIPSANKVSTRLSSEGYPQCAYFAVFDGHNGDFTSSVLAHRLHEHVLAHKEITNPDPTSALVEGCLSCDEEILQSSSLDVSGSTAIVVFLTKSQEDSPTYIFCANVGDSRAILSRHGDVIELSVDQKATRPDELKRIENAGGHIVNGRVQGVLAISRAFGDAECKRGRNEDIPASVLTASPEVMHEEVQAEDDFIVVATDGLWDIMSNQQVVNFLKRQLAEHGDVAKANKNLVEKAIASSNHDNVTVVTIGINQGYAC